MGKNRLVMAIIFIVAVLCTACSSGEAGKEEAEKSGAAAKTEAKKEETDAGESSGELTFEDLKEMNLEEIPESYQESINYGETGKFAGFEFNGQKEIQAELDRLPVLTEESTEEEIDLVARYLLSIFKEDYVNHSVPLEKWDELQFSGPQGGTEGEAVKQNYNVAVLLDSSGSMANMDGGRTRMDLAKEAIEQYVAQLPEGANVSLRVYGHTGSGSDRDKAASCAKIEEVYPLGAYQADKFKTALSKFKPAGWTPMAKAIEDVQKDFAEFDGEQNTNVIYIVSDGVETCEGNPVAAIKKLADSDIEPVVNIIGYQVDNEGLEQLKQMADASGGHFVNVRNQEEMKSEFERELENSKMWYQWFYGTDQDGVAHIVNNMQKEFKEQLYEWHLGETEKRNREGSNLQTAINYLGRKERTPEFYTLDLRDIRDDYVIKMYDEESDLFLEASDINNESYRKAYDKIEKMRDDATR